MSTKSIKDQGTIFPKVVLAKTWLFASRPSCWTSYIHRKNAGTFGIMVPLGIPTDLHFPSLLNLGSRSNPYNLDTYKVNLEKILVPVTCIIVGIETTQFSVIYLTHQRIGLACFFSMFWSRWILGFPEKPPYPTEFKMGGMLPNLLYSLQRSIFWRIHTLGIQSPNLTGWFGCPSSPPKHVFRFHDRSHKMIGWL